MWNGGVNTGKEWSKGQSLGCRVGTYRRFPAEDVDTVGRILGAALDGGINFFDTAERSGNSEELIGKTVAHRRDEIVLAAKEGHLSTGSSGQPWTGEAVKAGIDRSLVKLKTEHLDLIQVHADDISASPPDDVLQALIEAKNLGRLDS